MKITISCPSKLNLYLRVGEKTGDFHEVETIMIRTKKLEDFLTFEGAENFSFEVIENYHIEAGPEVPAEESNSVIKAIRALEKLSGRVFKYKITLEKNIPPRSGLGGAASNAAAALFFLNERENLKINHQKLMKIGAEIGKDIPFFLSGEEIALGTHFGEQIEKIPGISADYNFEKDSGLDFEIHFTGEKVSTAEAYANLDKKNRKSILPKSSALIRALINRNPSSILQNLHNDFEEIFNTNEHLKIGALQGSSAVDAAARDFQMFTYQSTSSEKALLIGSGGAFAVFRLKNKHKSEMHKSTPKSRA